MSLKKKNDLFNSIGNDLINKFKGCCCKIIPDL